MHCITGFAVLIVFIVNLVAVRPKKKNLLMDSGKEYRKRQDYEYVTLKKCV